MSWIVTSTATTAGNWLSIEAPGADEVHVIPLRDHIGHVWDDCPCGPELRPEKRQDGSVGWLVVHSSLDGREAREVSAR